MKIAQINPLRYRGYYYDNETGMYYLQSRYYNPQLCRFISADQYNYINTVDYAGTNAYVYCSNDPINYQDPKGTIKPDKEGYIDLGYKGWKYRIDRNQGNYKYEHGDHHIHLENDRLSKHYSQNDDGSPHDKNNNSSGTPNKKVKEKLKEKAKWDWDAKEKAYKESKNPKPEHIPNNIPQISIDIGLIVFAVIAVGICIVSGVGIICLPYILELFMYGFALA